MIAYDLSLDAATQDFRFDEDAGDFVAATSPAMEAVKLVLGTERGSCPLRPDEGVDWSPLRRGAPNAAATVRRAVLDALAPLLQENIIAALTVEATATAGVGGSARYGYRASFRDPTTGVVEQHEGLV